MRPLRRTRAGVGAQPSTAVLGAADLRMRDVAAAAQAGPLWLLASRDHLALVASPAGMGSDSHAELQRRLAWIDLDLADWDASENRLTLVPSSADEDCWTFSPERADELLAVVRERLNATLVLERHSEHDGQRITVVARRARPVGPLLWRVRYAAGTDPDDPHVRRAAALLLRQTQDELGYVGGADQPSGEHR